MLKKDLEKLYYICHDGTFSPIFTYDEFNSETQEFTNLIIVKSGEERYKEWLKNKGKQREKEPTEGEIWMSNILLENAKSKKQMTEQQELTAKLLLQIAELKGGNTNV